MNTTTKRHARTLDEAFGPYTSHIITEDEPLFDWDGIWIVIGCAALVASPYLVIAWRAA
jgi:hypothetical protein